MPAIFALEHFVLVLGGRRKTRQRAVWYGRSLVGGWMEAAHSLRACGCIRRKIQADPTAQLVCAALYYPCWLLCHIIFQKDKRFVHVVARFMRGPVSSSQKAQQRGVAHDGAACSSRFASPPGLFLLPHHSYDGRCRMQKPSTRRRVVICFLVKGMLSI